MSCSTAVRHPSSVPEEHKPIELQCSEKLLWPAHPGEETKEFFTTPTGLLVSDTFRDACGFYYRAWWEVSIQDQAEVKGRTWIEKIGSQFKGHYETGPTMAVPLNQFLYLTELGNDEGEKIRQLRNEAFRNGFRLKDNAFVK